LTSFKTVFGATNVQDALLTKLRPSMDPTGTFQWRHALVLYLAYLDQLIREAIDLAPNVPSELVDAKRRYTTPVWRPGGEESLMREMFNEAAAVSNVLGRKFLTPDGISIAECMHALVAASAAPRDGRLEVAVFTPHAQAATALAFTSMPTRFVTVCELSAGITDLASFEFDETVEPPTLIELKEARQCSALACDELDRILIDLFIRKGDLNRESADDQHVLRSARLIARDLRQELFRTGKSALRLGWRSISIRAQDLAEDERFRAYQQALAQTFAASLQVVARRSRAVGEKTIDVVLLGEGATLPFLPALIAHAGKHVAEGLELRVGPLSPADPRYAGIDPSLRAVFPQLAATIGGALVELLPAQ